MSRAGLTPEQEQYLADVRQHLEDGASYADPLLESVEDECPTCGAYMLNPALHDDFHRRQREQFEHLDRPARRYMEPPRYGGRS